MTNIKLKHLIIGGLLSTGLIASSFVALAKPASSNNDRIPVPYVQKGHHGGFLGGPAKQINLSSEQQAQIKQILEANKANVQGIREKMHDNQLQIRKLSLSDDKDKAAKIEKLAKTQGKLMTKMIVNNAKIADEMRHVLTPEQIAEFTQLAPAPESNA